MDVPMPALRLPAGVATATTLPTEVLIPLAAEAATALPNAAAPVSVATLPRLAPPPMASVEPAAPGAMLPTRAVNETLINSFFIVTFPSFRLPPRRVPGRVMPPRERFHHSLSPSSLASSGELREPRHGSSAGSHRSRCKDGSCRSPHPPAKCRRRYRTARRKFARAERV